MKPPSKSSHPNTCRRFVIASHHSWNAGLVEDLSRNSDYEFILVSKPSDLNLQSLRAIQPRYIFFPHWSHRISEEIFNEFECVIFHMTDLPFGRGGSPLQNLITRGIYETQITALKCVEELDAGPIYLKRDLSLYGSAEEIFLRASRKIKEIIQEIISQEPPASPQVGKPVNFSRRQPAQSNLAGAKSLEKVFDMIRMLDAKGYPHAFLEVGNLRLEFTRASLRTGSILADVNITILDGSESVNE